MDLNLQPLATTCYVSGTPFEEGARVASFLVRNASGGEVVRYDVRASESDAFQPPGVVSCRWIQVFKHRRPGTNPDRELKLTAETLFLTLADPATERTAENTRLVQFLALMLERKRVLKPKGPRPDADAVLFEHTRTKTLYEVPAGELTPEFFMAVQEQLSVLVGEKKG
jgi:hypothetical protein